MLDDAKVAKWLRQEDGKTFLERVRERKQQDYDQLRGAHEPIQIGRVQGRLEVWDWILSLRED